MTLIVNFFGGPGCGKSTIAAGVFYQLKRKMFNAELVTEFAKDLVWEKRKSALDCQPYIFGKQLHKIERLINQTDIIVTDSPILLSVVYNKKYPESFTNSVVEIFNNMNNLSYFIDRNENKYDSVGREQTIEEAVEIDNRIKNFLDYKNVKYQNIIKHYDNIDKVIKDIEDENPVSY